MPLNSKGKKIKDKMVKQYGKKKGESVFYAMENSGKLKKVVKLSVGGGRDASKGDFGTGNPGPGDTGGAGGYDKNTRQFGNVGSSPTSTGPKNVPTARKGPIQVPTIGPLTYAFNKISTGLYNAKNLKDARKDDLLGGEMLTTGQKKTGPAGNMGGDGGRQMCPDGTVPPCKSPTTYTPPAAQAKPNTFLSGFQAYEDGGEVIVSANVDEDLL